MTGKYVGIKWVDRSGNVACGLEAQDPFGVIENHQYDGDPTQGFQLRKKTTAVAQAGRTKPTQTQGSQLCGWPVGVPGAGGLLSGLPCPPFLAPCPTREALRLYSMNLLAWT